MGQVTSRAHHQDYGGAKLTTQWTAHSTCYHYRNVPCGRLVLGSWSGLAAAAFTVHIASSNNCFLPCLGMLTWEVLEQSCANIASYMVFVHALRCRPLQCALVCELTRASGACEIRLNGN